MFALQDGATVDRGVKIREEATQLLLVPALGLKFLRGCRFVEICRGAFRGFFFSESEKEPLQSGSAKEGNVEDLAWNLKKVEEFLAKAQEEAKQSWRLTTLGELTEGRLVQPLEKLMDKSFIGFRKPWDVPRCVFIYYI